MNVHSKDSNRHNPWSVRTTFVITMSTDADRAATEKAEADKKAAEDAAAAATATAAAWPIGGYTSFIPLVFLSVIAVLTICVDVSTMCVVHALLDRNQCVINAVHVMLMIHS